MARNPWRSGLWWALLVVLMGGVWVTFAPTVAGGQSAYVIVAGASMEPTLRRGDLVIARRAPRYQVGDIVTYQHPTVGPVIHRVIEQDNGIYTLQGDANSWTDSYHPAAEEILGKAWIHLPRIGSLLTWLRLPPVLGLLSLVISALVVTMIWPSREPSSRSDPRLGRLISRLSGWAESASTLQVTVFILGLMILLGALLAVPAWSRPLTRSADRVFPYTHSGRFQYTAYVPVEVYGTSRLETGQPAYRNLTRRLGLTFDYAFHSDSPADVSGTLGLAVEVRDTNGWSRRLILQEPQAFEGTSARVTGILDLKAIAGYLDSLEERTGVTRPYYTLRVLPTVQVEGRVAGLPLATLFTPELKFLVDDLQLQLAPEDPTLAEADPLAPRQEAAVETRVPAANRLTILGLTISVETARWISGVLLTLGLGGLGLLAWAYTRAVRRDPLVAIQLKYGAELVGMQPGTFEIGGATVDLASLDDLARVAEKHGRLIHWVAKDGVYEFFVPTGDTLYACRVAIAPAQDPPPAGGGPAERQA